MAKAQVELGNQVYLWTNGTGLGGYAPKVIISAHGWCTANTGTWAVGASTLVFFVKHSKTLDDIGSAASVKGIMRKQVIPGDNIVDVVDYTLGKYQEHKSDIKAFAKMQGVTFDEADNDIGGFGVGETYGTYRNMDDNLFDYVTIRNRTKHKGGSTIALSEVIEQVRAVNAYTEYLCAFCREVRA